MLAVAHASWACAKQLPDSTPLDGPFYMAVAQQRRELEHLYTELASTWPNELVPGDARDLAAILEAQRVLNTVLNLAHTRWAFHRDEQQQATPRGVWVVYAHGRYQMHALTRSAIVTRMGTGPVCCIVRWRPVTINKTRLYFHVIHTRARSRMRGLTAGARRRARSVRRLLFAVVVITATAVMIIASGRRRWCRWRVGVHGRHRKANACAAEREPQQEASDGH